MKNLAPDPLHSALFLSGLRVLHDRRVNSAALNMATDEALLQTATAPLLRFYEWRRPALSFGYFGRYDEAAVETTERELVRRWTGGGIVRHGRDLTYSVIIPRLSLENMASPPAVYRLIHGAIQRSLSDNLNVSLAPADAPKVSDVCFANAVTSDVLFRGRKIAGAAQRRTRAGLLHQGSIQLDGLPAQFRETFAAALSVNWTAIEVTAEVAERAQDLAASKYETREWLERC